MVKLLLRKSAVLPSENRRPFIGRRPRRGNRARPLRSATSLRDLRIPHDDDVDRQVHVSLPSSKINNSITLSDIQSHLRHRGIKMNRSFDESDNNYCRRLTLALEQSTGELLTFSYSIARDLL